MDNEMVKIELTKDEAIVLFEFLTRFSDHQKLNVEHQAEKRALWNLQCLLECELSEIFLLDFDKILSQARDRLKDKIE